MALARREAEGRGESWDAPTIITIVERGEGKQDGKAYMHIPDDFAERESLKIPEYEDTRTRLASIHLSSGTTGLPKGVRLTQFNFVANVLQLAAHAGAQFPAGSAVVAFTPFAHIGNTTFPFFLGPYMGIYHHAMPSYDLEAFAQLVHSVKPTFFSGRSGGRARARE